MLKILGKINTTHLLQACYFFSGFSALLYQTCWQRLLFISFGTDTDSMTVVISAFMAGLGLGSIAGGYSADKFPEKLILMFFIIETSIGLYGLFSIPIIQIFQTHYFTESLFTKTSINFLLMLLPSFMMGSTLPILTKFFLGSDHTVGDTVGRLYFINTFGAAYGALSCTFLFFLFFDIKQTIYIASILNLTIGIVAFLISKRVNRV
jgi:predicted membrane-bound spermidine synthase